MARVYFETFQKAILFKPRLVVHGSVRMLMKKPYIYSEAGHVDWKLSSGRPGIIKTNKLAL